MESRLQLPPWPGVEKRLLDVETRISFPVRLDLDWRRTHPSLATTSSAEYIDGGQPDWPVGYRAETLGVGSVAAIVPEMGRSRGRSPPMAPGSGLWIVSEQ